MLVNVTIDGFEFRRGSATQILPLDDITADAIEWTPSQLKIEYIFNDAPNYFQIYDTGDIAQKEDLAFAVNLDALKAAKREEIANARFDFETGGIDFGGMRVPTNRDTQTKLTSAYIRATENPALTLNWKVEDTVWVTLDAATIISIGDAVFAHVQDAFNQEQTLVAQIEAASDETQIEAIIWA